MKLIGIEQEAKDDENSMHKTLLSHAEMAS
jgi:hypothetical protein